MIWVGAALSPAGDAFVGIDPNEHPAERPLSSATGQNERVDYVGTDVGDFHLIALLVDTGLLVFRASLRLSFNRGV